ncbi:MAG TPA: hypothetical protein VNB90_07370 [Cytophagaceae bacterium]|jgi:hypothetical protein|nr:hypothetical protein [Cytophagaceae bacterium]
MNSLTLYSAKNKLVLLLLTLCCLACKRPQTAVETVSLAPGKVHQGITGKVLFKEGDFLSSGEIVNGKVYGVERQLFFYEPTNIKDAEATEGDFVKHVFTEVIDSVNSDKHGNFAKELPEGKYSIFLKESNRLYSKIGDGDYYMPVRVYKDSSINIIVEIDYKASYRSEQ